jgi:vitamin B12 transporter
MRKQFFVLAAMIISSQLSAQQDSAAKFLDEVILTANKYEKKQSETGKVITVIGKEQLERSGGQTINELLNTVAGTTIIGANNNWGTNQTVSIRGGSAGNALLLIDGIPVNDPSVITNYFDLNFISLAQVERIEILKGGQSTLYGSDAVNGVINIILKKAGADKVNIYGDFSGGSYNTLQQNLGINGRSKSVQYSLNYSHLSSAGFSSAYDSTGNKNFDNDKMNQHSLNGRFGFHLAEQVKVNLFGNYNTYKAGIDAAAFTDDKDFTAINKNAQLGGSITYNYKLGSWHTNYSYNKVRREYADDSLDKPNPFGIYSRSNYIGTTNYVETYASWKGKHWEVLAGGDYRGNTTEQSYFSTGSFGPYTQPDLNAKMHQVSPYASVVYKANGFTTELGGRWNSHSVYGDNFTFTFNPSYVINNKAKVFANVYSAFKTPTLYQLFDPFIGNTTLNPEKGFITEGGVELLGNKKFKGRLTGFLRNTTNAIIYTFNPSTFAGKYVNANKQQNYGAEVEASYTAGKFSLNGNYTFTDGKTTSSFDGTGAPIGKDTSYYNLYRIPKHAINLSIGLQASPKIFTRVQVRSVSKREEFIYGATPSILDGYATIDLYGEYKFDNKAKLFIDLRNITNKEYFDILGYNSRRFNIMGGVSVRF